MDDQTREKYLKMALVVCGGLALLIYPLGLIWPSGWIWHGGQGNYYLEMICGVYAVGKGRFRLDDYCHHVWAMLKL